MAYTGVFATEAELNSFAGENVDTTGWTEANKNAWISMVEAEINCLCRYNFTDNYGTLNADTKRILSAAASSWVAIRGISYNMSGYTSRIEAEDLINIHRDEFIRCLGLLKDQELIRYLKEA